MSVADVGGADGFGPVKRPAPAEPVFGERWEGRAFALTLLSMGRISGQNLDAFRRALGELGHDDYYADGYYGRWLNASESMLVESGILAPGTVDARVRRNAGEDLAEPPAPEPNKPDYAATGPGSLRQVDAPPAFAIGQRVRARQSLDGGEPRHTKLVGYVRGKVGTVDAMQPAHLLPDTHSVFQGENAQHVYTVRFDSHELWGSGPDTDAEPFTLTIELFESYLEPAE